MGRRQSLKRKAATRRLRPRHVILCEGKTEASILDQLRAHWRLSATLIKVVGECGDPKRLVHLASRYTRGRPDPASAATVHVVFDRDSHHHWHAAIDRARSLELVLGVSNPCFELWPLLLHRDHTAHIDRHKLQNELRKVHPRYDHKSNPYLDFVTVVEGMGAAGMRADALLARAVSLEQDLPNPTTTFHHVLRAIRPGEPD